MNRTFGVCTLVGPLLYKHLQRCLFAIQAKLGMHHEHILTANVYALSPKRHSYLILLSSGLFREMPRCNMTLCFPHPKNHVSYRWSGGPNIVSPGARRKHRRSGGVA